MSGIGIDEQDNGQERIRRYLLGRVSENERQLIEERIFTDPAFFQSIRMIEEELVEDYVFNLLPPKDAESVAERLLLTPEQIQRWKMTTALKEYSDAARKQAPPRPVLRYVTSNWGLAIAATIIVAAAVGLWVTRTTSLERNVTALNEPGQNLQSDFPIELPTLRLRAEPGISPPEQKVTLPKQIDVVQVRLPLEAGSYASYQTTLIKEPDVTLFTLAGRVPIDSKNQKLLIIRVPSHALVPGAYSLVIKGITQDNRVDDLGIYQFTIL